ncbi:MAG: insulinase family protein, partial [Burkholderiaceae bacterium]|nr:insulinase family protein [Burkholderiaceae bacterium]
MPYRLLSLLLFAFMAVGVHAAPLPQAVRSVEGITEYRLDNGLQVLLVPDDSKPTTTVNMTYHVGSRHENYGETGMAHLLEHLLFQGSTNYPMPMLGEFTKRGLRANGSTSFDRTNYFASFAANPETLKWYLDWQADAMVNSFISRESLDSEMTVVRNEMESGENNPQRIMMQRALRELFDWHNYGKSTIGARSDVENVDIPRLQAFYREYYQPDNATLVVSGKFDPQQTLAWVQQAFGKIPKPTRRLPVLYTLDPVQDGERSFTLRRSGGVPMVLAAYHAPAASDPDYAAAEALALILADEPAGRLYTALVKTQLAASMWGFAWDLADPGLMMFGAELAPGQDVDKARRALLDTLESFKEHPVTAEELARAKARWLNDWKRRFTNPEGVGVALSSAVGQGDWRLYFLLRDRVRDLKLEDVQRFAVS